MKAPSARRVVSWSPFAVSVPLSGSARGCAEDEGVTAVEDGEGRERVEARAECADADGGTLQSAFEGAVEADAAGEQALAGLGKRLAGIVAEDGGGEIGEAGLAMAKLAA